MESEQGVDEAVRACEGSLVLRMDGSSGRTGRGGPLSAFFAWPERGHLALLIRQANDECWDRWTD